MRNTLYVKKEYLCSNVRLIYPLYSKFIDTVFSNPTELIYKPINIFQRYTEPVFPVYSKLRQ